MSERPSIGELLWDFERALKRGETPQIEAYLGLLPDSASQAGLLGELIRCEARHYAWKPAEVHRRMMDFPVVAVSGDLQRQILSGFYTDAVDAGAKPIWQDYSGLGIPACELRLQHAEDCPTHYLGQVLVDRYQLLERLGSGRFGVVYRAWDLVAQETVAAKLINVADPDSHEAARRTLANEFTLAQRLSGSAVVRIREMVCPPDGPEFLVMDYVRGQSLRKIIEQGPVEPRRAVSLLMPVIKTLAQAHRERIFHRDLTPDNILVDEQDRAWLTDFGLSLTEEHQWAREGEFAGTAPYMAPELLLRAVPRMDGRSDLYSFGVILYEALHGKRPFEGISTEASLVAALTRSHVGISLDESVPQLLAEICQRCLQRNPDLRYDCAEDLEKELAAFLDGDVASGPKPPRSSRYLLLAWRLGARLGEVARNVCLSEAVCLARRADAQSVSENAVRAAVGREAVVLNAVEEAQQLMVEVGLSFPAFPRSVNLFALLAQRGTLFADVVAERLQLLKTQRAALAERVQAAREYLSGVAADAGVVFTFALAAAAWTPGTDPAEILALAKAAPLPSEIAAEFLAAVKANDGSSAQEQWLRLDKAVQRFFTVG